MSKNLLEASRRAFVQQFSGAAFSAPVLAQIATHEFKDSEDYWIFIRQQFLLEPDLIYLNAGTTGAMPRPVFEAEIRYQRMLAENPKVRHAFEYGMVPNLVRKKAAQMIGATLEETALTHNTT
jgi:selenocysteine lyase/cysteine desulfurase